MASYSPNTIWRYVRDWIKFTKFQDSLPLCHRANHQHSLALYVSHLSKQGKKASSIKTSLSGISWFFKIDGLPDPTKSFVLNRMLIGLKRNQTIPTSRAAPITLPILYRLLAALESSPRSRYSKALFEAIFLLAYYGAFRAGELVVSATPKHTLQLKNVSLKLLKEGWGVKITLPSYKHSSSQAQILLTPCASPPCPVGALKRYLKLRPPGEGELFILPSSKPVTRSLLAKELKLCVARAGLNPDLYNTHSFRAGRTTDLVMTGASESIIRETGRWKSDGFKAYVRFDVFELPKASPP